MLPELINAAVHWITAGLPLEVIKIYTNNKQNAERAEELFSTIKRKLQRDSIQANGFEYDVFISYSHKDVEAARLMSQQFKKENLSFFIDELELDKGVAWQQHIFEALDKSRVVLALYSPSYIKSKVCQEEFNIAWARNRNTDHEVIFPVYWSGANLPTYMDMLNYVDCRENDVNSLAVACDGLIEKLISS